VAYYDAKDFSSRKTVQDYVRGEEPLYAVNYPPLSNQQASHQHEQHHDHQSTSEQTGQIPLPPQIQVHNNETNEISKVELPMGDAPTPKAAQDFQPVPTVEQRRFSAPHTDWDPARYVQWLVLTPQCTDRS
jgi:hypothetical protein